MSEESPTSASPNGTSPMHDTNDAIQLEEQQPAVRRAIITNVHVLERGAGHEEHSGDDVSEGEGPEPEVIANDEDLMDDFPPDTEDVELVHLRIGSIPALRLERFNQIQKLCLRQNHIQEIQGLDHLSSSLIELDFYDNSISSIRNLEKLVNLENLDLSFNKIKHIKRVNQLRELRSLYLVQNKIGRIENLDGLDKLKNLELGANRIREIDNLHTLTALEQLWLGKNKITELKNLSNLTNLKILSIQSNRLTELKGLECLVSLEEIYVSHNAIEVISGLDHNSKLRVIDISNNRIKSLTGLTHLGNLEEVWASNNGLSSFEEVEQELADKKNLQTVYFEGNPLQRLNAITYRNKVRLALPQIVQIDATFVRA